MKVINVSQVKFSYTLTFSLQQPKVVLAKQISAHPKSPHPIPAMTKTNQKHSNQHRNKKLTHKGRQKHTAIVFDEKQRDAYLKGIFGAKNRRKEFNKKKIIEQEKQAHKQDKAQRKANRREELQKAKDLLFKLQENHKKENDKFEEKQVIVKQEGNVIVETKFY